MMNHPASESRTTAISPSTVPGAPRPHPGLIPRRRFLEWMAAHDRAPVRMISGGSGQGKTSALLSWLIEREQDDSVAVWLTLDDSLRDRGAFWLLVLHQLDQAGVDIDIELDRTLRDSGASANLLPALLVRQLEAAGDVLMVIDNADLGAATEVADDLKRIITHVARFRLIFTTRSVPGTTRAEEQLGAAVAVCPPEVLLLDPAEISEMAQADAHPLHPAQAAQVREITHGWPLAVRAELMSLGSETDASVTPGEASRALGLRLLTSFRHHPGFMHLQRRALAPAVASLDLEDPLLDLLDELARNGLGWWENAPYRQFRLQPVVRGLLREEYERADPHGARAEYLLLAELHDARDEYAAAFDAALRAEAWPMAIRVYRRHLFTLTSRPANSVLSVRRVSAEAQRTYPQLAFAVALDDFAHGRRARAVRGLSFMLRRLERGHLAGRHVSVEDVWTQAIITMSHRMLGRHEMARSSLRRVQRMLERVDDPQGELDPAMSLFFSHGALVSLLGDDPQYAARFLGDNGVAAPRGSSVVDQSRLYGIRALVAMLRGEVDEARQLLAHRSDLPLPDSADSSYTALPAMIASARLRLEDVDPSGAARMLARTRSHATTTDLWPLLIPAVVQVRWHLSGPESALMQLDEELAAREGRYSADSIALVPLTALRMHLLLSQGRAEAARRVLAASPRRRSRRFLVVRTRLELVEGSFQRAAGHAAIGMKSAQGPRERQTFALLGASAALHQNEEARAESLMALVARIADEHGVRMPLTSIPLNELEGLLRSHPALLSQVDGFTTFPPPAHIFVSLTPREAVVLRAIVDHGTVAEISAQLAVSENTVKSQLRSLYRKLGVSSRIAAVDAASRAGLL